MPPTTTVRITTGAKLRLEKLAQRMATAKGRKATQQEVLEAGLRFLDEHALEFLDEMAASAPTPDEWDAFLKPAGRFPGVRAQDKDSVLYGGR